MMMLNKINFNEQDQLYILGDTIDRGPEPIKVLEYTKNHENVHLIMGNHEQNYILINNNILVHASVIIPAKLIKDFTMEKILKMQSKNVLLWNRSNLFSGKEVAGYNIICGHTPTQEINGENVSGKITKLNGKIDIDCGIIYNNSSARLGCLKLEDMKEFYVDKKLE